MVILKKISDLGEEQAAQNNIGWSLTSIIVNYDMSLLPAMSVQLRHKAVDQTQRSYCRIKQGAAEAVEERLEERSRHWNIKTRY